MNRNETNRIQGAAKELGGKIKKAFGRATGNEKTAGSPLVGVSAHGQRHERARGGSQRRCISQARSMAVHTARGCARSR